MKRLFGVLASTALTGVIFFGCGGGGTDTPKIAPGTDTRTAQEKESDETLQKSLGEYNKKVKK
jgi:hypothetical protein